MSVLREAAGATREILVEAVHDGITGEAAKAAYYYFLSLFPAILALFALTGIVGGQAAFDWVMAWMRSALPGSAADYLARFVQEVTNNQRPTLLSFGLLFAILAASNMFAVLMEGLNIVYDVDESRSWWKRRALALVAFVASLVLIVGGALALLAGPELVSVLGLGAFWQVLRWPIAFAAMVAMMWIVYYLFPNRDQRHSKLPALIGAVVGTLLWIAVTLGFRFYVANFSSYDRLYGFVGGIMVLLLWLYLTAATILFGGEVAATLEQRSERPATSEREPERRERPSGSRRRPAPVRAEPEAERRAPKR